VSEYLFAGKEGRRGAGPSLVASPSSAMISYIHFAPFSYHFILFLCFRLPPNIIVYHFVRRGSIL